MGPQRRDTHFLTPCKRYFCECPPIQIRIANLDINAYPAFDRKRDQGVLL